MSTALARFALIANLTAMSSGCGPLPPPASSAPTGFEIVPGGHDRHETLSVVSWGPNRLDLFFGGTAGTMCHKWLESSDAGVDRWGPEGAACEPIDIPPGGNRVSAVSWAPGVLAIFAVTHEGQVAFRTYEHPPRGDGWSPDWVTLPGGPSFTAPPQLIVGDGFVHAYGGTPGGSVYHAQLGTVDRDLRVTFHPGTSSAWRPVEGGFDFVEFGVATPADGGDPVLFGRTNDLEVRTSAWPDGQTWRSVDYRDGTFVAGPSGVAHRGTGGVVLTSLFLRTAPAHEPTELKIVLAPTGGTSDLLLSLQRDVLSAPTVLGMGSSLEDASYEIFALEGIPDGSLARARLLHARVTRNDLLAASPPPLAWTTLGTNVSTTGKPRVVSWGPGRIDVFTFDLLTGAILHKWIDTRTPSLGWQPRG